MNPLLQQLTISRATTLAWSGDHSAAETLLHPGGELLRDPSALDLLARLRAQQGDYAAAENLWKQVLKTDTGHPAAIAGIHRIRRRRASVSWPRLVVAATVLASAWVIATAIVHAARDRKNETARIITTLGQHERHAGKIAEETHTHVETTTTSLIRILEDQKAAAAERSAGMQAALLSLSKRLELLEKQLAADALLYSEFSSQAKIFLAALKALEQKVEALKPMPSALTEAPPATVSPSPQP